MRFPLVWRKTAEDEAGIWKAEAVRERRRAELAERGLTAERSALRRMSALHSDLLDEHEAAFGPLTQKPTQTRCGFDEGRARKAAARIAELPRAARRARAHAQDMATAEKGAES